MPDDNNNPPSQYTGSPDPPIESDFKPVDDFATGVGHAVKDTVMGIVDLVSGAAKKTWDVVTDEPGAREKAWENATQKIKDANTLMNPLASPEDKAELAGRLWDDTKNIAQGIADKAKDEYAQGGVAQAAGYVAGQVAIVVLTEGCGEAAEGADAAEAAEASETAELSLAKAKKLAAEPGDSPLQRAAREKVAKAFYASRGETMSASSIESHMAGIDMSKPVSIDTVPAGETLYQHAVPGKTGQYFAFDPATTPSQLGINDTVQVRGNGDVPRVQQTYEVQQDTTVLKSTAAPVNDTWSVPGQPAATDGGGEQLYWPRAAQDGRVIQTE